MRILMGGNTFWLSMRLRLVGRLFRTESGHSALFCRVNRFYPAYRSLIVRRGPPVCTLSYIGMLLSKRTLRTIIARPSTGDAGFDESGDDRNRLTWMTDGAACCGGAGFW